MIEEELVRAEVHLQDIKNQDPAAASSGVSGGIIGAIRKTSVSVIPSATSHWIRRLVWPVARSD